MAYSISGYTEGEWAEVVKDYLQAKLRESRFTVRNISVTYPRGKYKWVVQLHEIRLRASKGYCGNHAGPCKLTGRSHKRLPFLEGLDWVSFNDMVNDVLDYYDIEADVRSSVCIIRKERERRMSYLQPDPDKQEFEFDTDDFMDNCGGSSTYADCQRGTPGLRGWEKHIMSDPA